MTKVDFYTGSTDKLRTTCQLSHKAMQNGLQTVISLPDAARAEALDKLLWHYPDSAFLPHCDATAPDSAPIFLAYGTDKFPHHELLISLHNQTMPFFSRFDRLIEIIGTDADDSQRGRERYKYYRDRGYELRHFDLSGTNAR